MSTDKSNTLDVTILDREFRVACPPEERAELLDSVAYLDKNMREIRDAGKITSVERIAIMAALNITHELLTVRLAMVLTCPILSVEWNPCRQPSIQSLRIKMSCFSLHPAVFDRLIIL